MQCLPAAVGADLAAGTSPRPAELTIRQSQLAFERWPESLFSERLALSAEPWNAYSNNGSLNRAAFWIHLRQDIHIALVLECPVRVDHALYEQAISMAIRITDEDLMARGAVQSYQNSACRPPSLTLVEARCNTGVECARTNRLVGLTCRIINYCFDSNPQSIENWSSLLAELESWDIGKPNTFLPFFDMAPDPENRRPFPEIHLQNDWHGTSYVEYNPFPI